MQLENMVLNKPVTNQSIKQTCYNLKLKVSIQSFISFIMSCFVG